MTREFERLGVIGDALARWLDSEDVSGVVGTVAMIDLVAWRVGETARRHGKTRAQLCEALETVFGIMRANAIAEFEKKDGDAAGD